MNANELADKLWGNYLDNNECKHGFALSSGCHNEDCKEQALYDAATMLRQQQAEIEALKGEVAQLKHINKNWQISENILLLELEKLQSRELTDEEIMDYVEAFSIDMGNVYEFQPDNVLQMIRAILDKAQEK